MDLHMMHPDLAAQAQAGAPPPVGQMHDTTQQQQQQQGPHGGGGGGGYHALQPSHQPSQQHRYAPASSSPASSSHPAYTTTAVAAAAAHSPAASSTSSATVGTTTAAAGSPSAAPAGRLGHVLHTMQQTGFHAWGFVIYRGCAYGDEPAWQRFMAHMKREVHSALAATPRLPGAGSGSSSDMSGRQLAPYLEWTVMEDPSLEGASTETVRRHFAAWAAARGPRRDGPGADGPFIESHVPRFMYCVYIDRRCLRTLAAFDDWLRLDRNGPMQYLACALIDKNCPPHGEGDPGMAPVDGCDRYYTGWMYAHVGSLPELYNTLGHQRLISGPNNYARPPRIYPGHLYGASVPP
ncbi:hypothetical protein A9K55_008007 [Cordyceps militaris]|uniref:Uncharacterized protein n=1 Tax=Cordyceps militaris TaxID=73501 RepID=A0A2H4SKB2_CORMI|nr:hypothetical protein A9K55_008007 [Cordyceps militaris]